MKKIAKKKKKDGMFLLLGIMALMVWGCGAKKMETTEVPKEPVANEPVKAEAAEPTPEPMQKYVVREGDTLWAISHQPEIYSDSFQWPLLFKSGRDQIQDPDKITPGQVLMIPKGQSEDQVSHARQLASDTPAFKHHDEPRKTLPLDYF